MSCRLAIHHNHFRRKPFRLDAQPLLALLLEANDGHFGQGTQSAEV